MNWIKKIYTKDLNIAILLFVLNVILVFPVFFANLGGALRFDDIWYINSGRRLIGHEMPSMSYSPPLLAVFYALIYLPVKNSPYWLLHCYTIGHFIIFSLLWWSFYLVAKQISYLSHNLIMIVMLMASPVFANLLINSSDSSFAVLSALAFWQFLLFYHNRNIKHLWFSSFFTGLSALCRPDGLVLVATLILLSLLLSKSVKRAGLSLTACIIPFAIVLGGYLLLFRLVSGYFEFDTGEKTYDSFEICQGGVYYRDHFYAKKPEAVWPNLTFEYYTKNPLLEGVFESRKIYGTAEENSYSVLNAVRRNPEAFFQRMTQSITKQAPKFAFFMYGSGLSLILFLLAVRGAMELASKKLYLLLCIMLLWPVNLLIYFFVTCFRAQYFLLSYFVVFPLSSVGLTAMVTNLERNRERYIWYVILLVLAVIGIFSRSPYTFIGASLFLVGLWIAWVVQNSYKNHGETKMLGIIAILCVLLVVGIGYRSDYYPPLKFRTLGTVPEEKAALFLREHLETNTKVGGYFPWIIWSAKMEYVYMDPALRYMTTDQDLLDWIAKNNIKAIFVDDELRNFESSTWAIIERQIGKNLEVAFTGGNGSIQILFVTSKQ